jgi:hypothetical protein
MRVVMDVPFPFRSQSREEKRQFAAEMELLHNVHHPNICRYGANE